MILFRSPTHTTIHQHSNVVQHGTVNVAHTQQSIKHRALAQLSIEKVTALNRLITITVVQGAINLNCKLGRVSRENTRRV